jgi:DNA-binding response OmpR family regulator
MNKPFAFPASVLLVDGHKNTLAVMSKLLRWSGYSTATAATLAQARQLCESKKFDLVVTEARLSDGNGMTLLSQTVGHRPRNGIVVSADSENLYEHLGLREQWNDYLLKPIRFEDLLAAIRTALAASEMKPRHLMLIGAANRAAARGWRI